MHRVRRTFGARIRRWSRTYGSALLHEFSVLEVRRGTNHSRIWQVSASINDAPLRPSLQQCSACALSSYVRSVILTDERFLHFQLRQDNTTSALVATLGMPILLTSAGMGQM